MTRSNPNSKRQRGKQASELISASKGEIASSVGLVFDIRALIDEALDSTARVVNSAIVVLYWSIGKRIQQDILG